MKNVTTAQMAVSTREALRNLFVILGIEGESFDEQLFELATRAFSAHADIHKDETMAKGRRKTLISHGSAKAPRRQIEIKGTTFASLRDLHAKMFPFLPWQSWDWFLQELDERCRHTLGEASYDSVDEP